MGPFQRGRSIPDFAFDRGACRAGEGNFFDRFYARPFTKLVSFSTVKECSGKNKQALHIVPYYFFCTGYWVGATACRSGFMSRKGLLSGPPIALMTPRSGARLATLSRYKAATKNTESTALLMQRFDDMRLGMPACFFDRREAAGFSVATDLAYCHLFPRHEDVLLGEGSVPFTEAPERRAKGEVSP